MGHGYKFVLLGVIGGLGALAWWTPTVDAYTSYTSAGGCEQCHGDFRSGGDDLHSMHLDMAGDCTLCHTSIGDDPLTNSSSAADGQGCRGCHGVDNGTANGWGAGLRAHHANAGVGADPDNGLTCANCHGGDPAPSPEPAFPPYYGRAGVNLEHPCYVDPAGTPAGEDYDGDGQGLDNDGDLEYDFDDAECMAVPVEEATWGNVKALYR